MTAVALFHALGALPTGSTEQYDARAKAVSLELSLPNMYLDLAGSRKAANDAARMELVDARATPPAIDAIKAALRVKYPTAADTPNSSNVAARIDQWFHTGMAELDTQWTNLFRLVDMRNSNADAFEIFTGDFPVMFKQRAAGEKIEIARVPAGSEVTVKMVEYGAGVGILDRWIRYNKWWQVEDVVASFRAQHWDQMAERHYGLFTSLPSSVNFTAVADDPLGTKTLNAAAAWIYRQQQGKGTGANAATPLWIVTSPEKVGYITRMLEATQGSLVVSNTATAEPLVARIAGVIATNYVAPDDNGYYLALPGRRIARGVWQDLQTEQARDIYKRADDIVGTAQYNAILGDNTQVRRVLFPA